MGAKVIKDVGCTMLDVRCNVRFLVVASYYLEHIT